MTQRFFGMDIHKQYVMLAAVNAVHEVVVQPTRIEMCGLAWWAEQHLTPRDEVVLEAGCNAWHVFDLLSPYAGEVLVANPYKTKLIAEARIKNDKVDALVLAQLLASRFICQVWVPDAQVREQRSLAVHRATLQKQCTRIKNRLHSVLHRHNLRCPEKSPFSDAGRDWLLSLELSTAVMLEVHHLLRELALFEDELDETDRLIARLATGDPRVPRLMQATGIGYYTAFSILASIGNIRRFPSPHHLTSYTGLVPCQHQSGKHSYHGHITKAGNTLLRWLMVEAARTAVRWDPYWRRVHARIAHRRGSSIATVAVARKLLVSVWHLLTDRAIYFHLQPQTFVRKLQDWAHRIGRANLPASSSKQFVYDHLIALQLDDLAHALIVKGRKGRLYLKTP
jgi:transposase